MVTQISAPLPRSTSNATAREPQSRYSIAVTHSFSIGSVHTREESIHTMKFIDFENSNQIKIKSSLYSRYYADACNEYRGPSPRLSTWATQLRRNVAAVASHWRHCVDLTDPGFDPQTYRTDSGCAKQLS